MAEYAASLIRIGATDEALNILEVLDASELPQVLFFRAIALFTQWEYARAIPLLSEYVRNPAVDEYQQLVGKVNLAAALVHERRAVESGALLRSLEEETAKRNLRLLYGNVLELIAQDAIFQGKWTAARKALDVSEAKLQGSAGTDAFFVRKWKTVLEMHCRKSSRASEHWVHKIRTEALERKHWETLRDFDQFEAVLKGDLGLALHLYFGTPHPSFRARLLKDLGNRLEIPPCYVWHFGPRGAAKGEIDLQQGTFPGTRRRLKTAQILHRLLICLSSDFYRPWRLPSIYYQLYPTEYFNPSTSPLRVHQAMSRLRRWVESCRLPMAVRENDGLFWLESTVPMAIRVFARDQMGKTGLAELERLRTRWPTSDFSVSEAGRFLGVSARSTLRLLRRSTEQGTLNRIGRGRATRYRFHESKGD